MRNLVIVSITLFGLVLTGCGDVNINQPAKPTVIIEKNTVESPVTAVTSDETVAPAPENADISYFYTSLSQDGSWTNDKEYGWSWSPAIAVSDSNWRPYVDNGSWVYTDNGWYWNSGYKWGWAAFHYGRWSHRENRWYWHPDNVWGSSWVSWRNNDAYYGWAPLTPQARWGSSGGLDVNLTAGNFDHNIGLSERDYCFVHSNNFLEVNIHAHQIPQTEVVTIYNNTTVINNYTTTTSRVVNHGIPVKTVAVATKQDIKPVTIVDNPAKAGETVHAGSMRNNRIEVFRPALAAKAAVDPIAAVALHPKTVKNHAETKAKPKDATERQAEQKSEADKRAAERAAKEQELKSKPAETPRNEPTEPKSPIAPKPAPEVIAPKSPAEHTPPHAPEAQKSPETKPKAAEPAKAEPKANVEAPASTQKPDKTEKSDKTENPEKTHKLDKLEKADKTEKVDKAGNTDKSENSDKPKKEKTETLDK